MHLVVELSDVLLYVWQQASEGELLDELSDVVVVIQGETGAVAPCWALWLSGAFLQLSVSSGEGVQAPRAAGWVQLQRMAVQAGGRAVCQETGKKLSSQIQRNNTV